MAQKRHLASIYYYDSLRNDSRWIGEIVTTLDEYSACYKTLIVCIAARIPVILWGPPGQGKT